MTFCTKCGKKGTRNRTIVDHYCNECRSNTNNTNLDAATIANSPAILSIINSDSQVQYKSCGEIQNHVDEHQVCSKCASHNIATNNLTMNESETASDATNAMNEYYDNNNNNLNTGALIPVPDKSFWQHMDTLLETKFTSFEGRFKKTVLEEVHKITEPIKDELTKVSEENTKLKAEITVCKASQKTQDPKTKNLEKVVKEQQSFLARADKDNRLKRILIAGVPENEDVNINGKVAKTDREKAMLIIQATGETVNFERARRIGPTNNGQNKRHRFILVEFSTWTDRNRVKQAGEKLKQDEETKNFYFKADFSKHDRDEFTRLWKMKDQISKDDSQKLVEIKYGKLFVNDIQIDQINHAHQDF